MKRVLILFLFLIPIVNAISIDNIPYNTYNLGDNLFVSGTADSGFVFLTLNCNDQMSPLGNIVVIKGVYSKIVPLTGLTGDCKFTALNNETAESNAFKVATELLGKFSVSSNEVQLGDEISINGYITNLNKDPINGIANIYIKKDNNLFSLDTTEIKSGDINYNTNVLVPEGTYAIELEVADNFGNKQLFALSQIKVNTNLVITSDVDKSEYKPGNTLKLTGYVLKTTSDKPSKINLTVYIDDKSYEFTTNEFSIDYQIAENTKSYKHDIKIEATDDIGNKGIFLTQYYVDPIATYLEIELNKTHFKPSEEVSIRPVLYDQAKDFLPGEIDLEISNFQSATVKSGETLNYKLKTFLKPDNYNIKAESFNLNQEKIFYVDIVKEIEVILNGQVLTIFNKGNVVYDEYLEIKADNAKEAVSLYLKPNATYIIELNKLFEDGEYTITISKTNQVFDNVIIFDSRGFFNKITDFFSDATSAAVVGTNKNIRKSPLTVIGIYLFILLFITGTIRSAYLHQRRKKDKIKQKEVMAGRKRLEELKKEGKKYNLDFGKATKEDIADFRNRVIKSYNDIERKEDNHNTRYEFDRPKERKINDYDKDKETKSDNVFSNMFG